MKIKRVFINDNGTLESKNVRVEVKQRFEDIGVIVEEDYKPDVDLLVCIGGDGSLLQTLKLCDFPTTPIIGINTGHLGYFQELQPDDLNTLIDSLLNDKFEIQDLYPVVAKIETENFLKEIKGLNEIVIRGADSHSAGLKIFIDENFIVEFIGDGILVATPAGSTAYNYSLGGSIVDPRLSLLQVTPIAPINSSAYRSFTSSILLPPDLHLKIIPQYRISRDILLMADGMESRYPGIKEIHVGFSKKPIKLMRLLDYDFWDKVKKKLL